MELLVAMLLGLLLITAALAMLLATSRTNGTFDALARTQEAGRLALVMMERDLRMAGYRGCAFGAVNSLLDPTGSGWSEAIYDFNEPFFGWRAGDIPAIASRTLPGCCIV